MNPFFDKEEPIEVSISGYLPHWLQNGKMQYVTFRLADSLPQSKISELRSAISNFNESNPKPWDKETFIKYWKIVGPIEEDLLDKGYGDCILQNADIRKIFTTVLWFNASKLYDIVAYVIMPNHVHLILLLYENQHLENIIYKLKGFTANRINRFLHRKGKVWMSSYFDRIIRSERHLQQYISYIENNPRNFQQEQFELYVNDDFKR